MSKWSKEDVKLFNNSEVFSQLESNTISNIMKVSEIIKESQSSSQKVENFKRVVEDTSKSVQDFKQQVSDLAEDGVADEVVIVSEDGEAEEYEIKVRSSMILELEKMAAVAIDDSNYADLYKIERTIQEIKDYE